MAEAGYESGVTKERRFDVRASLGKPSRSWMPQHREHASIDDFSPGLESTMLQIPRGDPGGGAT